MSAAESAVLSAVVSSSVKIHWRLLQSSLSFHTHSRSPGKNELYQAVIFAIYLKFLSFTLNDRKDNCMLIVSGPLSCIETILHKDLGKDALGVKS